MAPEDYARRRAELARLMGENAIAILPGAEPRPRNRDTEYPFRQDSDFAYLTGFPEPEAVLVLAPGRREGEFVLFCRDRDADREIWDGRRAGPEGAQRDYGADEAHPIERLDEVIVTLLAGRDEIYYSFGYNASFDQRMTSWLNQLRGKQRAGIRPPRGFMALDQLLHEMRVIKSEAEIAVMQRSADIAAAAHRRAMGVCRPGIHEYELEAEFLYTFRRHTAVPSYPPIVGAGANGCILHYIENSSVVRDGDLVLIDAGAEYDLYASDITRTFPANGRFSAAQRELYDVVLEAQLAALKQIQPGTPYNDVHMAAVEAITRGLRSLGILQGEPAKLIESEAYKPFFMHRTGHFLGMDVHDVGSYKVGGEWRELEAGMTLTVEPGVYIRAGAEGVDKRFWDIGIRIEDDVLVTTAGPRVLSAGVPKDADAIESLMAAGVQPVDRAGASATA